MFRALVAVAAQNNPTYGTHLPFPFSLYPLTFLIHLVLFIFSHPLHLSRIVCHVLFVSHIVPPSISGLRQPWSLVEGDFVSGVFVSNSASCAAQMPATLQDDRRYSGNCDKP